MHHARPGRHPGGAYTYMVAYGQHAACLSVAAHCQTADYRFRPVGALQQKTHDRTNMLAGDKTQTGTERVSNTHKTFRLVNTCHLCSKGHARGACRTYAFCVLVCTIIPCWTSHWRRRIMDPDRCMSALKLTHPRIYAKWKTDQERPRAESQVHLQVSMGVGVRMQCAKRGCKTA
jgi:hypothetical protein